MGLSISVAMCTFNGEPFLDAQLGSISAQTRRPDELVVCDDLSSDGSAEIVRQFARSAPFPVRLVVNDRNLGSTRNFEKAISLCNGSIVALADQDDVWYQPKLRRIEQAFLLSGQVVAAFSDADVIGDDSKSLGLRLWESFLFDPTEQRQFASPSALDVLVKHPVVTGATLAFRKELFELVAPIPVGQVHDRWISFLLAARGFMKPISEPLMQYRQHSGQQIGPGPLTLREQMARANKTRGVIYLEEVELFHELYDWLERNRANFPYTDVAQEKIKRKISHLQHRAQMPVARVKRIPRILGEAFNGGYWRYSSGWRSIAKDLVIAKTS